MTQPYAGGGSASSYRRPFPFPSTVLKSRHLTVRSATVMPPDALCSEMGFALFSGGGPGGTIDRQATSLALQCVGV